MKALCVIKEGLRTCKEKKKKKKEESGGRSRPQGQADRLQLRMDARPFGLVCC